MEYLKLNNGEKMPALSFGVFDIEPEDTKEAVLKAKRANKNIEFGICGEQGADEESIKFLAKIGIDYISCSPYRIPNRYFFIY